MINGRVVNKRSRSRGVLLKPHNLGPRKIALLLQFPITLYKRCSVGLVFYELRSGGLGASPVSR